MNAMAQGLADGVIDIIATDHAPHNRVEKLCTFEEAAMGISVLETALGSALSLVHAGQVGLPLVIEKLTSAPAALLGRSDIGTLRPGCEADVTIFDPDAEWVVDTEAFVSKGKNSPLHGVKLGRDDAEGIELQAYSESEMARRTVVGGEVVFQDGRTA